MFRSFLKPAIHHRKDEQGEYRRGEEPAAPMIGGMVTSTILTLLVIPVLYALWRWQEVKRR